MQDQILKEQPGVTYLEPPMKFNLGTLKSEPYIPKKIKNKKLPRREKIKVWVLIIILLLIILMISYFYLKS